MAKILLVEDDSTFSQLLQGFLSKYGYEVDDTNTVKNATALLSKHTYDLFLLDYRLPDGNGLDLLLNARKQDIHAPAIVMTSFNDVRTAVKAMRSGAFDYITKPVNPDELLMVIKSALKGEDETGTEEETATGDFIRGTSDEAKKLYDYIDLVAPTEMAVVIQGESGTGKEHAAKFIHLQSKRAGKPFIAVDCGALSKDLAASELFGHVKGAFTGAITDKKGLFEAAEGGTLFLDEIGNLSYEVQVKLLRALQEHVIQPLGSTKQLNTNIRLISATNEDLINSVSNGDFRQDLYHRINEFKINMPALRQRGSDLTLFMSHFIKRANKELDRNVQTLSAEASDLLHNYDWPGNLRELKNVIRRMVLLTPGTDAGIESLPDEMLLFTHQQAKANDTDLKAVNEANERTLIQETLQKVKFNKSKAAKMLNIDRKTLYSKMERYGLKDD
ncbi:sigma-54 dependent transcriptional regulator [Mucilaginibacter gynuensis]|uniref:Sigma-54 dependent transcriptional regulator n=1 Tax=Mucilaginibacter gynuensis TaxID=1302236 RepID=A0ABP8FSM6_9SPHI